jgi:hypothetical protein
VGWYVGHLGTISIVFAGGSAAAHVAYYRIKRYPLTLQSILQKLFAGYGFPTGGALVICATQVEQLQHLKNPEVYILTAGVCVLYASWVALFPARVDKNTVQSH